MTTSANLTISTRWTDPLLDHFRTVGDPPADAVVRTVFEAGTLDDVNRIMRTLVENDDLPSEELPAVVRDYLVETAQLPEWADPELMLAGARFFTRYGPEMVQLLFGASLPVLYAAHPGNEVLVLTKKMTDNMYRRIVETAQFVLDVTEEDAFEPHGHGIRTTQKVRLMHATIRHFLAVDPRWSAAWRDEWRMPICQSDLAGTMLSFSVAPIQGLEKSNVGISREEKEAFLHLWKVIGHLLGIVDDLLPTDWDDALDLFDQWKRRNHKESEAGRILGGALVDFMTEYVPGRLFDGVVTGWTRLWSGDEVADMIGVPPYDWTLILLRGTTFVWGIEDYFEDRVPPLRWLTRFWARRLLRGLMRVGRGGKRPDFAIPAHLHGQWGLSDHPEPKNIRSHPRP